MSGDDIRFDVTDNNGTIHEIFIMSNGEVEIWSKDTTGNITNKKYGKLTPHEILERGTELRELGIKLMSERSKK